MLIMSKSQLPLEMVGDLVQQSRWIGHEIGQHGHSKTHGYEEKLRRLKLDTSDPTSVMGFMGRYWGAFKTFDAEVSPSGDPRAIVLAHQQLAKVSAGLVDKVGLVLWISDDHKDIYAEEAAELVLGHAVGNATLHETIDYPGQLLVPDIEETLMGEGIKELHNAAINDKLDSGNALVSAVTMATHGLYAWQAYTSRLRDMELDATPPKPGEPSGTIVEWTQA